MDNEADKLTRYLDGELSTEEKESLEKELSENPKLQEELDNLRNSIEAVKLFGLQQRVAQVHGEMMRELSTRPRRLKKLSKFARYTVAVAASILLLVGAYMIYNFITLSSDKVFASRYQPYELITVRDDQSTSSELEKAYREKDYKRVLQVRSKEKNAGARDHFLSGIAALELKDNSKAIEYFKSNLLVNKRSGKSVLNDEAEYFLALAYIRNKDYDYALPILKSMRNDPNHVYHKKVSRRLVRQVTMLKWR